LQSKFAKIKFLVVDEADRLFKVGQFKEAEDIIGALDGKSPGDDAESSDEDEDEDDDDEEDDDRNARQTLVFSATFDKDLQTKLAGKGKSTGNDEEKMAYLMKCLKFRGEPKFIDVNPVSQMAQGLKEGLIECGAMEKVSLQDKQDRLIMLTLNRIFISTPFSFSTLVAALSSSPTPSLLFAV
jgi:ATP-dependent RNA helicase DDX24/MAK5